MCDFRDFPRGIKRDNWNFIEGSATDVPRGRWPLLTIMLSIVTKNCVMHFARVAAVFAGVNVYTYTFTESHDGRITGLDDAEPRDVTLLSSLFFSVQKFGQALNQRRERLIGS